MGTVSEIQRFLYWCWLGSHLGVFSDATFWRGGFHVVCEHRLAGPTWPFLCLYSLLYIAYQYYGKPTSHLFPNFEY